MPTPSEILKQYWGYDSFRHPQEEIIRSVLDGKDTLALLPTGGGKSVCFQVPGLMMEGLCLVVSPLIALMKDQVFQLKKRDIRAGAIFTGLSRHEMETILDNAQFGWYKFLYVSPERLKSDWFRERLKNMQINLLAVDEAHCISQWGYDFRPTYMEIAEVKNIMNPCPVLALTASATLKVQDDIMEKLGFREKNKFTKSFQRDNLVYISREEEAKPNKLLEICQKTKGSGIIYTRSRNKAEEVAEFLRKNKEISTFYHAGLNTKERSNRQDAWITGEKRIIASTNAFGMGIDKADVRFVIHLDMPESLEAYYQEAGRAGRDGKRSYAVLLYKNRDLGALQKQVELKFPDIEFLRKTYLSLCNFLKVAIGSGKMMSYPFNLPDFCKYFHLEQSKTFYALKILEQEGVILLSEGFTMPARVRVIADKNVLYKFEVAHEKYDALIKLLLRTYGGIIDHYVKINEEQLGKKLKMTRREIISDLIDLSKLNILRYNPSTDEPHITLLNERIPENDLRIDLKRLELRKKQMLVQIESMVYYATQSIECRQVAISRYFGEETPAKCGKCDNCLANRKLAQKSMNFDEIKTEIYRSVKGGEISISKILNKQNGHFRKEEFLEVIRFLLDEQQIRLNEKNELIVL